VKAYRLLEWQQPPQLVDVPVPEPGPGEVLVRVGGAGACHSDISVMEQPKGWLPFDVPFTLGHENAGWVARLGAGAMGFSEGDPVAVYGPWGCGTCRSCIEGMDNVCERWRDHELRLLQPELIVTVGGLAARRLLGVRSVGESVGGRYEYGGAVVIPLPHPSGASGWLNDPANRTRVTVAAGAIRQELARLRLTK